MKIGLCLANEIESFFVKKELEYVMHNISFINMSSRQNCVEALNSSTIDAYVTTKNDISPNQNTDTDIDWFSFSWYEDYPYTTIFFGKGGNRVITPSFASANKPKIILDKTLLLSDFHKKDTLAKTISKLNTKNIFAFTIPGRAARYIKEECKDALNYIETHNIPIFNKKPEKEFTLFYKKNNTNITRIIPYFVKCVTFVGAGVGDSNLCSIEGVEALKNADVCLYDSLLDHSLLRYLPNHSIAVNVGKRHHRHSVEQPKINQLITYYAKYGFRVVRLKSGDPSIFGRLAEEIDYLEKNKIPYRVIPGISSISALSNTGIVLTRRGVNRGFCVMSPVKHGGGFASVGINERKKLPVIFFMGVRVVDKISKNLIDEGYSKQTKVAMVFSIGSSDEFIVKGTLETIGKNISPFIGKDNIPPGLFIVGDISDFSFKELSVLKKTRVIIAGMENSTDKISIRLKDLGAIVMTHKPKEDYTEVFYDILPSIDKFKFVAFSDCSLLNSFIKTFIDYFRDIFKIPNILISTKEMETCLNKFGLHSYKRKIDNNAKILYPYLRRNNKFAEQLLANSEIEEKKILRNINTKQEIKSFKVAIFLDSESFWDFIDTYGTDCIKNCYVWIGKDNEVLSFLNKKSANFGIIPENFINQNTDIRFLLYDETNTRTNKLLKTIN